MKQIKSRWGGRLAQDPCEMRWRGSQAQDPCEMPGTNLDEDGMSLDELYGLVCSSTSFLFDIVKVIFSDPATIVIWADGTKTVVKAYNEPFDKEKGLAMAICKKVFGNKGSYNNIFKRFLGEENG